MKPVVIGTKLGPVYLVPEHVASLAPTDQPGLCAAFIAGGGVVAIAAPASEVAKALGWEVPASPKPGLSLVA